MNTIHYSLSKIRKPLKICPPPVFVANYCKGSFISRKYAQPTNQCSSLHNDEICSVCVGLLHFVLHVRDNKQPHLSCWRRHSRGAAPEAVAVGAQFGLTTWMNEWLSEVLSILFECLVLLVFRQGELALSSIQRWVDSDAWVSGSSANTASIANIQVNGPYMLFVRTDFCCCMLANLSSGMHLLLKKLQTSDKSKMM